jgi:hypothetical protein
MATAVIQGATLKCSLSDTPSQLTVTSQGTVEIANQRAATVEDRFFNTNIAPFGTCKKLTADASGTPMPCALSPAGLWQPGSSTHVLIGTVPALLSTDKLLCAVSGEITVVKPGQQATTDT